MGAEGFVSSQAQPGNPVVSRIFPCGSCRDGQLKRPARAWSGGPRVTPSKASDDRRLRCDRAFTISAAGVTQSGETKR